MIYSQIETRYITSSNDDRLVRYDSIRINADTFVVKVWDDQQQGIAPPSQIIEVAKLVITRDLYRSAYGLGGFQMSVARESPPAFEDYVWQNCQKHRDSI